MFDQAIISSRSLKESLNETLTGNFTKYAAKNVSNDFDFTKLLFTSEPTPSPTLPPTLSSTLPPTLSPTLFPTITTSSDPTIHPTPLSSSVPSVSQQLSSSIRSCPEPTTSETAETEEEEEVTLTKYVTFFNYEVVTPNQGIDIVESIQNLEERILDETASSIMNCDGTGSFVSRRLLDGDAKIVRVESDPPDVKNELNGTNKLFLI